MKYQSSTTALAMMGVALLCLTVARPARGTPQPEPKTGLLFVDSQPMAQVFLGEEAVGLTPVKGHVLMPGSYLVELRAGDGRSRYLKVEIVAGATSKHTIQFGPPRVGGQGILVVSSEPWSQVFLDGRAVGSTPLGDYQTASRSYNMELRTTDGRAYKRIVFVERGQTTRITHRFQSPQAPRPVGPSGWLSVNSAPPSQVWIHGKNVGSTPLEDHDLPVGLYSVTLKTADGRTHVRELRIERLKTTELKYEFPPKEEVEEGPQLGYLSVTSNVEAEVRLGPKHAGYTPLLDLPVKPGRHQITLVASKRLRRVFTVQILAGHTRTISVTFPKR